MNRRTVLLLVAPVAVGAVVLAGCAEIEAERTGIDVGEDICDLRNADSEEEFTAALAFLQDDLVQLGRIVGRPVEEDLSDIQENLDDLREHTLEDHPTLRDQDVNAIRRNVEDIADHLEGAQKAAYDGVSEGLADCS